MSPFLLLPVLLAVVLLFAFRRARPGAELIPALAIAAWFAVVFALERAGMLAKLEEMPPKIPLLAFGAIGLGLGLSRVKVVKQALEMMPAWWPVALQTFRAPLELALYSLFVVGLLPEQMTFTGRNFDVLVGVTAPVMAFLIATKRAPRWLQWAWQLGSVALLVNVVSIAITSAPGPLHLDSMGAPLTIVAQWPYALLPSFMVPVAALGHVLAIGKLLRA
ncbi:MAG: hypothetical protein Q8N23_35885 [Archangium sp.]|nr:hypothetical protein [Archangium sp.]MDP3570485.1 hypothetical protein [Archangium sp.]